MIRGPVKIATGFPSAARTAKKLGVSKKMARDLASLAERSLKTGEFVLPGVGRLVRVHVKSRVGRSSAIGEAIKIPAKKVVKFRVLQIKAETAQKKIQLKKPPRKPNEKPWWEEDYKDPRKILDRKLFA